MEFIRFMTVEFLIVLALGATATVALYCHKIKQEKVREAGLQRFAQHLDSFYIN